MNAKDEFIEIYQKYIKREGADRLLQHLLSPQSDFFTAPASTRFHGAYEGGLAEHSINVYECLCDYLARERVQELYGIEAGEETIAIVAHRAPQLALEVLTKNISWEEALEKDWRKTKSWQPGWEYIIN